MTFVSSGQAVVFLACVLVGLASGIVYAVLSVFRYLVKSSLFAILCDLGYYFALMAMFLLSSERWQFPNLQAYMPLGVFVGCIISCTLLRNTLAKPLILLYNLFINKLILPIRVWIYDRRKIKKTGKRVGGNRSVSACDTSHNTGLSNGLPISGKKGACRASRGKAPLSGIEGKARG